MILILCSNTYDASINYVLDWLIYYKHEFIKITPEDIFTEKGKDFRIEDDTIFFKGINLNKEINSVWYRKFPYKPNFIEVTGEESMKIREEIESESEVIVNYILHLLKEKNCIGLFNSNAVNKPLLATLANKYRVKTPKQAFVSTKVNLEVFLEKSNNRVITKKSSDKVRYFYEKNDKTFFSLTTLITKSTLKEIPDHFFTSYFQECIDGEYEVRTIFLDGLFYSSVLINEKDEYIDKKNIISSSNSSVVPYQLNAKIENNLRSLLEELEMKFCTIELIKSKIDKEYYLVDLNPSGQFVFESEKCNYSIDKLLAKKLINDDK